MLPGNYLIAGSSGLMGTTALLRLRDMAGVNVRSVHHSREPGVFADNITHVKADLRDMDECRKAVEGIDYVFMFAAVLSTAPVIARNPVSHITGNMIMNAQMLEAAYFARVKKFVWLSSSTGYPEAEGTLYEENMFDGDPPDIYFPVGWMSRYTEVLCRQYATKLKDPMTTIILRPTTIYGEYEDFHFETSHVLPALVRRVVERQRPIEVWGTGENTRDLIYADDVLDACLLALRKVKTYGVFNVGLSKEYSINELLDMIIEADGFKDAEIAYLNSKPTTINKRDIDLTKAKRVLGFEAKTSIKEGIARMVEWYRNNPVADY